MPALRRTVTSALAAMRDGTLDSRTLVEECLTRIAADNTHLNAVVTLNARAARQAAATVDASRQRGEPLPLLAGIPITVKDAFATRDLPTAAGYRPLANYQPNRDATLVARLREEGAVLLGKTHLPELAAAPHGWSPLYGLCRNPWQPELTPGGSSAGSAVAVASGFSLLDLGSDLAGSIRIPAAYCGVLGLKTTEHRLPASGHIPPLPGQPRSVRQLLSLGLLGRSVADLHLGLTVLDGQYLEAPEVPPLPPLTPLPPLPLPGTSPLRLAFWDVSAELPLCPRTRQAMTALLARLRQAGHTVDCLPSPGFTLEESWQAFGVLAGHALAPGLPGWQRTALRLGRPLLQRNEGLARAFASGIAASSHRLHRAWTAREAQQLAVESCCQEYDALLCPVASTAPYPAQALSPLALPPPLTVAGRRLPYLEATIGLTVPFSLTGHPVVVLPAGITDGLPVGFQVVGPRWREDRLLAVAARLEAAGCHFIPPPGRAA